MDGRGGRPTSPALSLDSADFGLEEEDPGALSVSDEEDEPAWATTSKKAVWVRPLLLPKNAPSCCPVQPRYRRAHSTHDTQVLAERGRVLVTRAVRALGRALAGGRCRWRQQCATTLLQRRHT